MKFNKFDQRRPLYSSMEEATTAFQCFTERNVVYEKRPSPVALLTVFDELNTPRLITLDEFLSMEFCYAGH
jgi:hypothetical protein